MVWANAFINGDLVPILLPLLSPPLLLLLLLCHMLLVRAVDVLPVTMPGVAKPAATVHPTRV